jgi:hypothetical protein
MLTQKYCLLCVIRIYAQLYIIVLESETVNNDSLNYYRLSMENENNTVLIKL